MFLPIKMGEEPFFVGLLTIASYSDILEFGTAVESLR